MWPFSINTLKALSQHPSSPLSVWVARAFQYYGGGGRESLGGGRGGYAYLPLLTRFPKDSPIHTKGNLPLFTENPRRLILGNSEGMKRAGAVRDPGSQWPHQHREIRGNLPASVLSLSSTRTHG